MSHEISSIPRVKDIKTYYDWRNSITSHLDDAGLLEHIEPTGQEAPEDPTERLQWIRGRKAAFRVIWDTSRQASSDIEGRGYDDTTKDPYKLWLAIEATYGTVPKSSAVDLIQAFSRLNRVNYGSTKALINEFTFLRKRLEAVVPLPGLYYAASLLSAFRDSHPDLYKRYKGR